MKTLLKATAKKALRGVKKAVDKNPRIKGMAKKAIAPYFIKPDRQASHMEKQYPDGIDIAKMKQEAAAFDYSPKFSVLIPTYNTPINFLEECLLSVVSQVYDNWEICIVDDASPDSDVREYVKEFAKKDSRVTYKFLKKNQHIAGATNEAAKIATGDFLVLFDHDDLLWPNALFEVAKALNVNKELDFIYTDEDKITEDRRVHLGAFYKPDYNPDFMHSVNSVTHMATIRKSLYEKIGGEDGSFNGAQDWELFLRVARNTKKIHHIPKVVYSWRIHDNSTAKSTGAKPYVVEAQKRAITEDLESKGHSGATVEQDRNHPGYWNVTYPVQGEPLVSIIIPSKNQYKVLKRCIDSIYEKTTYSNFEIVLVDTGSDDKRVLSWYKKLQAEHDNLTIVNWPEQPFSYARSCNKGAEVAKGELLLMLNNDTEVITPDWIELMAGDAQRKEVGAVGCLLFYPDGRTIQHAGVGIGLGGVAANSFQMMTLDQPMTQTQHLYINTKHNMTAVTAACMMLRRDIYDSVGGFDEKFRITYNDVDLCLRLYEKGYQNVYTPHVRLLHHESISLGAPGEIKKRDTKEMKSAIKLFKSRWGKYIKHDPNINQALNKQDSLYDI